MRACRRIVALFVVALCGVAWASSGAGGANAASGPGPSHSRPRLLHGSTTTTTSYPWQAQLTIKGKYLCGGVLISPLVVLTAAHCADLARTPADITVALGRDHTNRGGVTETASTVVVDPHFERHSLSGDWGIVVLTSPAPAQYAPIQIAGPSERSLWRSGRHAVATGYGLTRQGGSISKTLRKVRLPILPDAACGRPGSYGRAFRPATMLCAGNPHTGRDTCQGDSGGPLVVHAPDGTARLVGIVSFGRGCAEPNYPGIYTRIAAPAVRDPVLAQLQALPQTAGYPYLGP